MSKIICDVCGTRYPDTAEQCPICGHIREAAGKTVEDVLIMDDARSQSRQKVQGGRFSKSNVQKRMEGTVHYEAAPTKSKAARKAETAHSESRKEAAFAEDSQNKKTNTILNALLVIVILALLGVTGFIFAEHILPQINKPEATLPPTEAYEETAEPTESREPTFPCEELVLEEKEFLFTEYEQKRLINVEVKPENTTDELIFTSGDELIASVDSEGCITALAEGQTVITISCGDIQVEYEVICLFPGVEINPGEVPTDPPPTEPPVEYVITTNYVNLRSETSASSEKLGQLMKGDKVWVYEIVIGGSQKRPWGRTENGWVCMLYAEKVN